MSKLVIGLAAFILLAAGGALAGNALTDSSPGVTTTATTLGTITNDDATTSTSTVETGEDLSGPCDEAEHANDPRCTGAAPVGGRGDREDADDDRANSNRGQGGDDRDGDDHGEDDRSGTNRGSNDDRSGSNRGSNDD
jgi:hypothetical protein